MAKGTPWTGFEVEAIVADYFAMLQKELACVPYSKTAHRQALRGQLADRSDASIEMKHRNITAILMEWSHPYIAGYKAAPNYQALLADVVVDRIESDAALQYIATRFVDADVSQPAVPDLLGLMREPPSLLEAARLALAGQTRRRHARIIDYFAREAQNRALGRNGEELVVQYERARLGRAGRGTLAEMVEHVAATRGDGLGYDVRSFFDDGRERFIEVKTTQLGPLTPFYISDAEVAFSIEHPADYALYRVFDFRATPAMYSLEGAVDVSCALRPVQFLGMPK